MVVSLNSRLESNKEGERGLGLRASGVWFRVSSTCNVRRGGDFGEGDSCRLRVWGPGFEVPVTLVGAVISAKGILAVPRILSGSAAL